MSAGITYFCTDSLGHTYTRYSARHGGLLRYTHAVVARRPNTTQPVRKSCVNYAAVRSNAETVARGWVKAPNWEAEVVEVRAYPGRHKVEPQSEVVAQPQPKSEPVRHPAGDPTAQV